MFEGFEVHEVQTEPLDVSGSSHGGAKIKARIGGTGPALLLLHGYPQTGVMWHKIAPRLAEDFTVVIPDLRGYGDSEKPATTKDHAPYSKREMAADQAGVMAHFGFDRFKLVGHDRGGRVAHRLAVDHGERVERLAVLDIAPTHKMYSTTDKRFATGYWHWFFLIQPAPIPETMIGRDPAWFIETLMRRWGDVGHVFTDEAMADYVRCFSKPETIHGSCEDYRAAATIDMAHDDMDMATKLTMPLLALWGDKGFVNKAYDVLECWRERAEDVQGHTVPSGHYLPEEAPEETKAALLKFLHT